MSYTAFKDSYGLEATYGTSVITAAGDTTYLFGGIVDPTLHPTPRYKPQYGGTNIGSREPAADGIKKTGAVYQGNMTLILQNGIPLYLAMGDSSTAGAGPYTHTITPAYLPSITLQHDRTGTGTDWGIQYTGVMCSRFALRDDRRRPGLVATMDWVAQDAADPGFVLTSTPALPSTATTAPFYDLVTATYNSNNLAGLVELEFVIDPGLEALMANWGLNNQHMPLAYVEHYFRKYSLIMKGHWENDDLWDDGINPANTSHDVVLKWQKSANDYIQLTLTDVEILYLETRSPAQGMAYETIECVPTQVSIEVKDSINGSPHYGE